MTMSFHLQGRIFLDITALCLLNRFKGTKPSMASTMLTYWGRSKCYQEKMPRKAVEMGLFSLDSVLLNKAWNCPPVSAQIITIYSPTWKNIIIGVMMTSYQILMTFFANRMKASSPIRPKKFNTNGRSFSKQRVTVPKTKSHSVTFHLSILVSQ